MTRRLSRRRPTWLAASLSLGAPLLIALASASCYGPTEVTLSLSTDLRCNESPRTRIYKGAPGQYDTTPEAEVSSCESGSPDARIGTLVIVPSGDKDGSAAVRVVLAKNNKAPADCDADPTDCIVATRSFSFVSHASRKLPIRLLTDCLGKQCNAGETCVAGRKCISDRVECATDDCGLPNEPPPPPAGELDGGPGALDATVGDAAIDGALVDGGDAGIPIPVPACIPSTGNDIITTTVDLPTHAVTGATNHVFINDNTPVNVHVVQVAKKGGAQLVVFDQIAPAAGEKPFGLAVQSDTPVVAFGDGASAAHVWNGAIYTATGMQTVKAIASLGPGRIAVSGTNGTVQERTSVSPFKPILMGNAVSLVSDGLYYYAATNTGISRIDPIPAMPVSTPLNGSPKNALLATGTDRVVHAAAVEAGMSTWGIWRLDSADLTAFPIVGGRAAITSLASDATHVYWTENNKIWRKGLDSAPGEEVFSEPGMTVDHVTVDAECLYFWTKRGGAMAALRLGPRKPFATVSAGP